MKNIIIATMAAMLASTAAHASESNGIGYDNLQVDYLFANSLQRRMDADGFTASGSHAFTDTFFGFASYAKTRGKDHDINHDLWALGAGTNHSIGAQADWVTKVAVTLDDMDGADVSGRERGNHVLGQVSTGVVYRLNESLQAEGHLGMQSLRHRDGVDVFGEFGLLYSFNPTWGLHAGVRAHDNGEDCTLGLRASF